MANRLTSVNSVSLQFPEDVREKIAENLTDPATVEGAALSATYGAGIHVGPTGTNDQAVIGAAVAAAAAAGLTEVWLRPGTYAWDADISPWTVGVALRAENPGATTIQLGAAATFGPRWAGTKTQVGGDSEVSTVAAGSRAITTAADRSASLAAGDWVLVSTNERFANRTYYMIGEWARVSSVSGTTVNLDAPLRFTYTSGGGYGIRIYRFNLLRGAGLYGVHVKASASAAARQVLVQFAYCDTPFLTRGKVEGQKADTGAQFVECRAPQTSQSEAVDIMDLVNPSLTGFTGYGFHTIGCLDAVFTDISGYRNRHTFDDSALDRTAPSFRTRVVRGRARDDWGAAWSTHGGSDECTFEDCVTVNSGGGFVLRGRAPKIKGGGVYGVTYHTTNAYTALGANNQSSIHGILIGEAIEATAVESKAGTALDIDIQVIDVTGGSTVAPFAVPIAFDQDTSIRGARICWGEIRGHRRNALRLWSPVTRDLLIAGGRIVTDTTVNTSILIDIDPTVATGSAASGSRIVAGNNQVGMTIEGITFDGYGGDVIRIIGNPSGGTDEVVSADIMIRRNRAKGKNTANGAAMRIGGGSFDARVGAIRVYDNQAREHNAFCQSTTTGQAPAAGFSANNSTLSGLSA